MVPGRVYHILGRGLVGDTSFTKKRCLKIAIYFMWKVPAQTSACFKLCIYMCKDILSFKKGQN